MTDVTPEVMAELIMADRKSGINDGSDVAWDEKENFRPSDFNNNKHQNNVRNKTILITIDARPFCALGEATDPSASTQMKCNDCLSVVGSTRVHYPNLLRKRSKGKMTMENVVIDQNARYLISRSTGTSQSSSSSSSTLTWTSSLPSKPTTPPSTPIMSPSLSPPLSSSSSSSSQPRSPFLLEQSSSLATYPSLETVVFVVVYDQNTPAVSDLCGGSDAKLALDALTQNCKECVRVRFLAGGIDKFYTLFPHLCVDSSNEVCSSDLKENMASEKFHNDLPCQLLPWLFIGNQSHSMNVTNIERLGITALLNVAALSPLPLTPLPIKSAPTVVSSMGVTWFPFTPQTTRSGQLYYPTFETPPKNCFGDKVPLPSDSVSSFSVKYEYRLKHDRRTARRIFYSKPLTDQSARGIKSQPSSRSSSSRKLRSLNLPIADDHVTEISHWFDLCNSFIDEVKSQRGRVLVHCQAGVSRSATICLAYLLWSGTFETLNEAFEYLRARRPVVAPNFNFLRQLQEYEAFLKSSGRKGAVGNQCIPSSLHPKHFGRYTDGCANSKTLEIPEKNIFTFTPKTCSGNITAFGLFDPGQDDLDRLGGFSLKTPASYDTSIKFKGHAFFGDLDLPNRIPSPHVLFSSPTPERKEMFDHENTKDIQEWKELKHLFIPDCCPSPPQSFQRISRCGGKFMPTELCGGEDDDSEHVGSGRPSEILNSDSISSFPSRCRVYDFSKILTGYKTSSFIRSFPTARERMPGRSERKKSRSEYSIVQPKGRPSFRSESNWCKGCRYQKLLMKRLTVKGCSTRSCHHRRPHHRVEPNRLCNLYDRLLCVFNIQRKTSSTQVSPVALRETHFPSAIPHHPCLAVVPHQTPADPIIFGSDCYVSLKIILILLMELSLAFLIEKVNTSKR